MVGRRRGRHPPAHYTAFPHPSLFPRGCRAFVGTPRFADLGNYTIRVTVYDPPRTSAFDVFVLEVKGAYVCGAHGGCDVEESQGLRSPRPPPPRPPPLCSVRVQVYEPPACVPLD